MFGILAFNLNRLARLERLALRGALQLGMGQLLSCVGHAAGGTLHALRIEGGLLCVSDSDAEAKCTLGAQPLFAHLTSLELGFALQDSPPGTRYAAAKAALKAQAAAATHMLLPLGALRALTPSLLHLNIVLPWELLEHVAAEVPPEVSWCWENWDAHPSSPPYEPSSPLYEPSGPPYEHSSPPPYVPNSPPPYVANSPPPYEPS